MEIVEEPVEKIVEKAEKTIEDLINNNRAFFESMKTPECISAQAEGVKRNLFGNTQRSFSVISAMLSIKDPRLELLTQHFDQQEINIFRNKRILDIGCHSGQMALQIGALYDPKLIIGVDID